MNKIFLNTKDKCLVVGEKKYPLTHHNGLVWRELQLTGNKGLLKKFSKVSLDI